MSVDALLDQLGDIVEVRDSDGSLLRVSAAVHRVLGWSPEAYATFALDSLIPADDRDQVQRAIAAAINEFITTPGVSYRALRADGNWCRLEATVSPVVGDDGHVQGAAFVTRDCTLRHAQEERLRMNARMEAVALLAGGMAHDFNNVLTVIHGSAEMILHSDEPSTFSDDARTIVEASERASTLTRQLLSLTRQEMKQADVHQLDAIVRGVEPLLQRLLARRHRLFIAAQSAGAMVRIDPRQLEVALMNLVSNARDAMSRDGVVSITTRLLSLPKDAAEVPHALPPGRYVRLAVADTGEGMTEAVRSRAFEPFFTTKAVGQGTGLGLATVYRIIESASGNIFCDSTPGEGTRFAMFLPVTTTPLPEVQPLPRSQPKPTRSGSVLLVDDQPEVRRIAERILTRAGYEVHSVESGRDALEWLNANAAQVHVVLTDFAMPEMNGRELLERIAGQWPDVRTVLMSGYADDEITRAALLHTSTPFLAKPFGRDQLVHTIEAVLARPAAAGRSNGH